MSTAEFVTAEESGAFIESFSIDPTASGPLDGLRFAVKDLIDIAGHKTGCGNPSWRETHPAAAVHAVCVEQLLGAGGHFAGKTVTDELAFSLIGENHFYGTPLNPKASDRVPGGSSSGSASAVACGLVDFALGTDTGGSVRVPAGNCGIWGLRPSWGRVSVAGVNPFAPTFDTVGVLAGNANVLGRAASALMALEEIPSEMSPEIHLLEDAFALVDTEVREALNEPIQHLRKLFGPGIRETSLGKISGGGKGEKFNGWCGTYNVLQWAEIESSLGAWIAASKPAMGPITAGSFDLVRTLDRRRVVRNVWRREEYCRRLQSFLGPNDLLCMPTAPTLAPLKGTMIKRDHGGSAYYARALALTSVAGLGKLPQISMPLGEYDGVPVGISLLAGYGCDAFLIGVAEKIASSIGV